MDWKRMVSVTTLVLVSLTGCSFEKLDKAPADAYVRLLESTPYQRILTNSGPKVAVSEIYTLVPKADFKIAARVLSINKFWMGDLARISPMDLALGWGKMSDLGYLRFTEVDISQGNRTYTWTVPSMAKANRVDIEQNSANVHIVPANDVVAGQLSQLSKYDLVYLEGALIDIQTKEGGIKTSLSRSDAGAGSGEVLYVKKVIKLVE